MKAGSTRAHPDAAETRLRASARRRFATVSLITLTAFFAAVAILSDAELADSDQPRDPIATVTIAASAHVAPIPRSYFGVSTEYWTLPLYERHLGAVERALRMLRVRGDGPFVVRIGGDSADHSFWDPDFATLPHWAFPVTPRWIAVARSLVHRLDARLIVDLNLVTDSPATAARWARAAVKLLPRHSIIGFEVGNEPDVYSHTIWTALIAEQGRHGPRLPATLTPISYVRDFGAYGVALHKVAPHIPLVGPALANPKAHESWIAALVAHHPRHLGMVTAHRYRYSACVGHRSPGFATIDRVLSENASAGMAAGLAQAIRAAHRAGLPFRLTELNSVSCSGRPGVSDAFATALWAPDVLFELLRAGVNGVNLHARVNPINGPFGLDKQGLIARPLLYGLIMFARALGAAPALVPLNLHADSSLHLKAWAVRTGSGQLHVLLINKGQRPVKVRLRIPAQGRATVERLLARSARSRFGVTLNGQRLGPNAEWRGAPATEWLAPRGHGYVVNVPRLSAALVSAGLRSGALTRTKQYQPRRRAHRK